MKIGVIGLGTVGYGVIEILTNEKTRLEKEMKQEIVVKYGCGLEEVDLPKEIIYTKDYHDVINDEEIDVVVELIGGTTIAKNIILEALNNKKHVVTANKALLAHYGKEIFQTAKANDVHIFYEASVGGGIPVLASQKESLIANNTKEIVGILNGTTNFILTLTLQLYSAEDQYNNQGTPKRSYYAYRQLGNSLRRLYISRRFYVSQEEYPTAGSP